MEDGADRSQATIDSHSRLVSPHLCGATVSLRRCRCDTRLVGPNTLSMPQLWELGGVAKYRGLTLEDVKHHHVDSIAANVSFLLCHKEYLSQTFRRNKI